MLNLILEAVGFYLPAYVANMMPIFFDKLGLLKSWAIPIDGGRKLGKNEIFGSHKTWRGLFAGVVGGFLAALIVMIGVVEGARLIAGLNTEFKIYIKVLVISLFWGGSLGLGALLGDLIKSFFKRRLGIKDGAPFVPFDQIDFALGAVLFASFLPVHFKYGSFWQTSLVFIIITPLLHLTANVIAYKVGWKKVWW
ncbi:MAG: CDP-2,3-bis-(O-geranylgeranyl)-sn-glycerol synthase [Candidatus Gracilibacteria bacterium]|jgi:CDP-2,3-bis-(O-geranylgeranyl)-sn-glycerol synthase